MVRKRKNVIVEPNTDNTDIKSIIHQNTLFFDRLVELIPARFYLPNNDEDKPWFQGLSKNEKAEAKKVSRENVKKARRDRLDPEKSKTTLDLLMQNLQKEKENDESEGEEVEVNTMVTGLDGDDNKVTYEELRQRLHRKIEELRGNRNSGESNREKKRNERNERRQGQQKKRKRESGSEEKKPDAKVSLEKVEKDAEEATKALKFSHVKLADDDQQHGKKKRKLSKIKELEKAKELAEEKKDPAKGMKHSWSAATSRAAGIKIHDDPSRLKHSIQKKKYMHKKNVKKWNERVETQHKMKTEKQQTRKQNIAERAQQKKMRKIAKREKKLMRTPSGGSKETTEGAS
ncbi:hypothetical protein Tsubulata_014261 [Turnera subulata]|uniref:Ribosomal RNA-processing protein 14/surfeit locus protein 6 C-terminal domain-containing protein n=1 Tax=Turnera subulata TaxID=218843 RepID=A0A9Q0G1Y2_9ROSI|nr:hypothetical protein Tsubulata_014261 [Turnera subulata]